MIDGMLWLLGRLLVPLSYMVPFLLAMSAMEHRGRYVLRTAGSVVLFSICFKALRMVYPRSTEIWSLPSSLFALLLVYVSVMLLMVLMALFCCKASFTQAFFCSGVAYTVQNLTFILGTLATESLSPDSAQSLGAVFSWASIALGAALIYLLFIRRVGREGIGIVSSRSAIIAICAALFFNIVFNEACSGMAAYGVLPMQRLALKASQAGLCLLILYMEYELLLNRRFQLEAAATNQLLRDKERQYETSREAIDAINLKCHDIRHQIRKLGDASLIDPAALNEIALAVNVYDARIDSGNKSLDTILTEKSLLCDGLGIEFTCTADGSKLSFLSPAELYSLFGNMLDNAIEATRRLDDQAKRVITLGVRENAGLITVHEENYFRGSVALVDGTPQSTKNDPLNHGYGFHSMRAIVEKHGGVIKCTTGNEVFCLDIAIPIS